jgi:vacuolar-type H+-ATPase subunit H
MGFLDKLKGKASETVKEGIEGTVDKATELGKEGFDKAKDTAAEGIDKAKDTAQKGIDKVKLD